MHKTLPSAVWLGEVEEKERKNHIKHSYFTSMCVTPKSTLYVFMLTRNNAKVKDGKREKESLNWIKIPLFTIASNNPPHCLVTKFAHALYGIKGSSSWNAAYKSLPSSSSPTRPCIPGLSLLSSYCFYSDDSHDQGYPTAYECVLPMILYDL